MTEEQIEQLVIDNLAAQMVQIVNIYVARAAANFAAVEIAENALQKLVDLENDARRWLRTFKKREQDIINFAAD